MQKEKNALLHYSNKGCHSRWVSEKCPRSTKSFVGILKWEDTRDVLKHVMYNRFNPDVDVLISISPSQIYPIEFRVPLKTMGY